MPAAPGSISSSIRRWKSMDRPWWWLEFHCSSGANKTAWMIMPFHCNTQSPHPPFPSIPLHIKNKQTKNTTFPGILSIKIWRQIGSSMTFWNLVCCALSENGDSLKRRISMKSLELSHKSTTFLLLLFLSRKQKPISSYIALCLLLSTLASRQRGCIKSF